MNYVMLVSRQGRSRWRASGFRAITDPYPFLTGKVRLAKWFQTLPPKAKAKIVKDVTQLVLARRTRMCNVLEYKGTSRNLVSSSAPSITAHDRLYRLQSHLPSLRLPILHHLHFQHRQRAHHPRNRASIRRSPRSVFRKRLRVGLDLQLSESLCRMSEALKGYVMRAADKRFGLVDFG